MIKRKLTNHIIVRCQSSCSSFLPLQKEPAAALDVTALAEPAGLESPTVNWLSSGRRYQIPVCSSRNETGHPRAENHGYLPIQRP